MDHNHLRQTHFISKCPLKLPSFFFYCFLKVHPAVPVLVSVHFAPEIPTENSVQIFLITTADSFSSNYPYFKSDGNGEKVFCLS